MDAERERLGALTSYDVLDTPPERAFDEIVHLAAFICDTPVALVTLIDDCRQWFKAKVGLEIRETARDVAFCAQTIRGCDVLVVPDALQDARFASNPLVTGEPHIRFYAGAPLVAPTGHALGGLCVIDRRPRELTAEQLQALQIMSRSVVAQLELRRRLIELAESNRQRDAALALLRTAHDEKEKRLAYLAHHSPETGLANRVLLLERLSHRMSPPIVQTSADTLFEPKPIAVVILDVERFHVVNDTLGRRSGDELLLGVAERLIDTIKDRARLAHLGADRFVVVAPDAGDESSVVELLGSILRAFAPPFMFAGEELRIAAKAGIAIHPSDGDSAELLLGRAEAALKMAKRSGDRYAFYSAHIRTRVTGALSLETKLRRAIEGEQFVLHYQPKVDLRSGDIAGLEALIRWREPTEGGLVPPSRFVPVLEETGLILEVGRWVLQQAALDCGRWLAHGVDVPRIAVNVSPLQLRQRGFVSELENVLDLAGRAHESLDIEITEGVLMDHLEITVAKLRAIREMKVRIAIDDFGTGFSSLRYLAELPIDTLKIDRSFVIAMTNNPNDLSIVSSIISLAHGLGLRVVAEGVETEEQRNLLRLLRCDEMQGYLYSPPVAADQVEDLLSTRSMAAARTA